ncbi:alpha/beta fold hydrolase [Nocardia sp. NPDC057668]|uniref:alpha/beta fold hydrolase n=1 Tax=Nocardia sp. NPDC057668 TaxID=3346202 RepID=UPI0036734969
MTSPWAALGGEITERSQWYGEFRTRVLEVPGEGPRFVLLHGFADSADTWRGVLSGLHARGRAATAVDMAGFGVTEPFAPGPLLPQLDSFADALLASTGPVVLVGNSLGVAISLRAAQRNPALVLGVCALDEPLLSDDWLARFARGRVAPAAARVLRRTRVPAPLLRGGISVFARMALWGDPRAADRALIALWRDKYGSSAQVAWLAENAIRFAQESVGGYSGDPVPCPVRIVHGRRDRIIPVRAGAALHRLLPGSEFIVLPRAGHCPQLDDPAGIADLLADFADRRLGDASRDVG